MRPYRRVDMGAELEDHNGRLRGLERLEAQVRVFQGLASMLLVTVIGLVVKDCQARDAQVLEQAGLKQAIEAHIKQPHGMNEATIEAMQNSLKEHGDRLLVIEQKVYIVKSKHR